VSSLEVLVDNVVANFKTECLQKAGWSEDNAELLATDPEIDWHVAYDLRIKCEDERLCLRILYGDLDG
jgi:hypothetical protein